jgi:hypothetical protein
MEAKAKNSMDEPITFREMSELLDSVMAQQDTKTQILQWQINKHGRRIKGLSAFSIMACFVMAGVLVAICILSARTARAERPGIDISNRQYHHPRQSVVVEEKDGWKLCGLNKQCLAEIAADVGKDTRTLVLFKAPTTFYIEGCYGNEVCYGGGPVTRWPVVKCGASGLDPDSEFAACQQESSESGDKFMWDEFDFSINYTCQYLRRKAHNRIGRVKNPSECYKRLASQSRRECIQDLFNPRYVCGYHAGETKNQWSAFVVEKF